MSLNKVLGAGLVLILLAAAGVYLLGPIYVWGGPMVEQTEDSVDRVSFEQSVIDLERSIVSVSQSGQGMSGRVDLNLGDGEVYLNETGNYIELQIQSETNPYTFNWELLRGQSLQSLSFGAGEYGVRGENRPGAVAVRSDGDQAVYRVEFRDMREEPSGDLNRIELMKEEELVSQDGWVNLTLTNEGRVVGSRNLASGESVALTETLVSVSSELE